MSNGSVRILVSVVGALCLAAGVLFGWIAATQRGTVRDVVAVPAAGQGTAAAQSAASQSASTSEGWSRVAQGAYALAKAENASAQTARREALEAAARAEKAASRADAAAAKAAVRPAVAAATAPPARRPEPHVAAARSERAMPPPPASDEGCRRAIIYERTAAAAASRQAAYNAAVSGLAMNAHCGEPQRTLDEAYLLAQRASAGSALRVGDWKADLRRSDELLARCIESPARYGTTRDRCQTRLKKNEQLRAAGHGR